MPINTTALLTIEKILRYQGDASKNLQNTLTVEYGTNSTYKCAHMPKTNSSSVKILKISKSSQNLVSKFFSIVRSAVVTSINSEIDRHNDGNVLIAQELLDTLRTKISYDRAS